MCEINMEGYERTGELRRGLKTKKPGNAEVIQNLGESMCPQNIITGRGSGCGLCSGATEGLTKHTKADKNKENTRHVAGRGTRSKRCMLQHSKVI
ncbi:hypothetical protein BJV78DRAFT_1241466 [Lactifluus subvellereus]|nr:hypothetical protein BJV78DRAFT_1241466 [Lactifluus subvellereus]